MKRTYLSPLVAVRVVLLDEIMENYHTSDGTDAGSSAAPRFNEPIDDNDRADANQYHPLNIWD